MSTAMWPQNCTSEEKKRHRVKRCLFYWSWELAQNRRPCQFHDLICVVHALNQAQTQVIVNDLLQRSLGERIGGTKLHGAVQHDVHVEVAGVPADTG